MMKGECIYDNSESRNKFSALMTSFLIPDTMSDFDALDIANGSYYYKSANQYKTGDHVIYKYPKANQTIETATGISWYRARHDTAGGDFDPSDWLALNMFNLNFTEDNMVRNSDYYNHCSMYRTRMSMYEGFVGGGATRLDNNRDIVIGSSIDNIFPGYEMIQLEPTIIGEDIYIPKIIVDLVAIDNYGNAYDSDVFLNVVAKIGFSKRGISFMKTVDLPEAYLDFCPSDVFSGRPTTFFDYNGPHEILDSFGGDNLIYITDIQVQLDDTKVDIDNTRIVIYGIYSFRLAI